MRWSTKYWPYFIWSLCTFGQTRLRRCVRKRVLKVHMRLEPPFGHYLVATLLMESARGCWLAPILLYQMVEVSPGTKCGLVPWEQAWPWAGPAMGSILAATASTSSPQPAAAGLPQPAGLGINRLGLDCFTDYTTGAAHSSPASRASAQQPVGQCCPTLPSPGSPAGEPATPHSSEGWRWP